jgi:hypothetical protein
MSNEWVIYRALLPEDKLLNPKQVKALLKHDGKGSYRKAALAGAGGAA